MTVLLGLLFSANNLQDDIFSADGYEGGDICKTNKKIIEIIEISLATLHCFQDC